ncbi:hypothetical protein QWT69_01260 [Sporosarcina oncorhynchi]|uniref:Uncharacterized protein n=1 Tax=Sporosarcina oncorhynchi TaxID=3056444 RepID=A0ABZ0L812_9BACL|nr:hypothetical protein [Sporosarcina sp. T2O-4]WOV87777.1 hypothetical protein QWT69_01260 [Sporosarcina sp. T2O-4]
MRVGGNSPNGGGKVEKVGGNSANGGGKVCKARRFNECPLCQQ